MESVSLSISNLILQPHPHHTFQIVVQFWENMTKKESLVLDILKFHESFVFLFFSILGAMQLRHQ